LNTVEQERRKKEAGQNRPRIGAHMPLRKFRFFFFIKNDSIVFRHSKQDSLTHSLSWDTKVCFVQTIETSVREDA
jgi:hypothetical protein